jgi:flagellar basal-body rod protein FlgB
MACKLLFFNCFDCFDQAIMIVTVGRKLPAFTGPWFPVAGGDYVSKVRGVIGMTMGGIFDATSELLTRVMQVRARQTEVIAGNLANIDTPGYQALELPFADALAAAMGNAPVLPLRRTHPAHLPLQPGGDILGAMVAAVPSPMDGFDRNTVDLDREMARLTTTGMAYQSAVEMFRKKVSMLKSAIVEGGK